MLCEVCSFENQSLKQNNPVPQGQHHKNKPRNKQNKQTETTNKPTKKAMFPNWKEMNQSTEQRELKEKESIKHYKELFQKCKEKKVLKSDQIKPVPAIIVKENNYPPKSKKKLNYHQSFTIVIMHNNSNSLVENWNR